jgi:hypothetical protein
MRRGAATVCLGVLLPVAGCATADTGGGLQQTLSRSLQPLRRSTEQLPRMLRGEFGRLRSAANSAQRLLPGRADAIPRLATAPAQPASVLRRELARGSVAVAAAGELFGRSEWQRPRQSLELLALDDLGGQSRQAFRSLFQLWAREFGRPEVTADGLYVIGSPADQLLQFLLQ